jgi:hypothetical protein
MPRELADRASELAGGNFSAFVSEALDRHVKLELARRLVREHEAGNGPISEEALATVDRAWPV